MHKDTVFLLGQAVRTGLLWKISPDGASQLSTPHFAQGVHLWVSLIQLKGVKDFKSGRKMGSAMGVPKYPHFLIYSKLPTPQFVKISI